MKILVLGSLGTLGSAFLENGDYFPTLEISTLSRKDLNFENTRELSIKFNQLKPDLLINCAGKIGGLHHNLEFPHDLLVRNAKLNISISEAAIEANIRNCFYFLPSCIYPVSLQRPLIEKDIWSGIPEKSSIAYASSKLMTLEMIKAANSQYDLNWKALILPNIFGNYDWEHGANGHAISMISSKIQNAIESGDKNVEIWGSGSAIRDFLYADDLAYSILKKLADNSESFPELLNVPGYGPTSIRDLAQILREVLNYQGEFKFDTTKLEGAPFKVLSSQHLNNGIVFRHDLKEALTIYLGKKLKI